MSVDYQKLKQLREETGVSFTLCKKALEETGNNIDESKKKLTQWGAEKVDEKKSRTASQGSLFSYIHHNKKIATLLELRSETDFVSSNDEFQALGKELAMQVASMPAATVEEFVKQPYMRDPKKTLDDLLKDAVLKFGENIQIARFMRWELGEK